MAFRVLLVVLLLWLGGYTISVSVHHGLNLLPVFFGDLAAMAWPGQFNADFLTFLSLSAAWVAWRHHFSAVGLVLAMLAFFAGGLFLCIYLLVLGARPGADLPTILLGERRAST
ncbi:MAG: hypothetical protein ABIS14_13045 [Sphingomonas sp.]